MTAALRSAPLAPSRTAKEWVVVYLVKYSELWCADECRWMEDSDVIEAPTKRDARRLYRERRAGRRIIIGRHVSTYRAKR